MAHHLACRAHVSLLSLWGQNIIPDHKTACMMSDLIVNDKPTVDASIGVTLACPGVPLACPALLASRQRSPVFDALPPRG